MTQYTAILFEIHDAVIVFGGTIALILLAVWGLRTLYRFFTEGGMG